MLSTLIEILKKGFEEREGSLRSNSFARALTTFIITNQEVPMGPRILSIMVKGQVPLNIPDYTPNTTRDIRIKDLYINDVRQYSINDDNVDYYTLGFEDGGHPTSCVFHGANGSGKTTIYTALEYMYLGDSDIAKAHGCDDALLYLRSIHRTTVDIDIKANLAEGDVEQRITGSEIPAAFCSECDYYEVTRHWSDKERYFARQLGYEELLSILSSLTTLETLFKLAISYSKNSREIDNLKIDDELDPSLKELKIKKKDKLRSDNRNLSLKYFQNGGEKYLDSLSRFARRIEAFKNTDNSFKELQEVLGFLKKQWSDILSTLANLCAPIVDSVVGQSLEKPYENIQVKAGQDSLIISLFVKPRLADDNATMEEIQPVEYFNTFRLKLFCVALKMALFCCAKKIHSVNMPFVIDDIFDSTDFSNRVRIRRFIRELIKAHDSVLSTSLESSNIILPIQLIFFTQDNIIGENVYHGIADLIYDGDCSKNLNVKYSRLYRPVDADIDGDSTSDIRNKSVGGVDVVAIKIDDCLN